MLQNPVLLKKFEKYSVTCLLHTPEDLSLNPQLSYKGQTWQHAYNPSVKVRVDKGGSWSETASLAEEKHTSLNWRLYPKKLGGDDINLSPPYTQAHTFTCAHPTPR